MSGYLKDRKEFIKFRIPPTRKEAIRAAAAAAGLDMTKWIELQVEAGLRASQPASSLGPSPTSEHPAG